MEVGPSAPAVRIHRAPDAEWERAIADLDAASVPVPLSTRPEWARHLSGARAWLVAAYGATGRCIAAVAVEIAPTRALPGHLMARAHHVGSQLLGPAGDAVLTALRDLVAAHPRILRLNLELLLATEEQQARLAPTLTHLGFAPVAFPRNYRWTLAIDLSGSEQDILASFSTTTRRDLRQWAERPVEMRAITDPRYADRLNAIARETFGRTGGDWVPRDWPARMRLCAQRPAESRLVGLFRRGEDAPEALLAYAWGCAHGDYAHYDDAGSTRVEDIKVSMAYPLMWDLVRWARSGGCRWFDMGGVTPQAEARADDPRAGIADFKRRFSKREVQVGAEWVLEPRTMNVRLANLVRRAAALLRR